MGKWEGLAGGFKGEIRLKEEEDPGYWCIISFKDENTEVNNFSSPSLYNLSAFLASRELKIFSVYKII